MRLHLWLHCRLLASFSTQKGASKVKKTKSSDVTCTKRLSSNILKYVDHASGPARSTSFGHGCHDLCLPRSGCLSSTVREVRLNMHISRHQDGITIQHV